MSYSHRKSVGDADNSDESVLLKLALPLEAAWHQAGLSEVEIQETMLHLRKAMLSSTGNGVMLVANAIKVWQRVTRNILSNEDPRRDDDHSILGSRMAHKNMHRMRRLGLDESEIMDIVSTQQRRRIPPFFWTKSLVRCLSGKPKLVDVKRAISPASIGRAAPEGDGNVVKSSLLGFITDTENVREWSFDYSKITSTVLKALRVKVGRATHWEARGTSSREYSRGRDGKRGETKDKIILDFMHLPLCSIVPDPPDQELLDILGNTVLWPENWDEFAPIGTVLYCKRGESLAICVDHRFGQIGLLWSLLELRTFPSLEFTVDEDLPCLGEGRTPKIINVVGSLPSRVTAQPEEGWKVRIITITDFCVSLLGSMGRHLLDPALIELDPLLKIGLRSAVKLYDSLVFLNGGSHVGIASDEVNHIHFPWALSADLTTATGTPYRRCISSVFDGWMDSIPGDHPCYQFLKLTFTLASLDRDFEMPKGFSSPVHRCGIMMGEGLSGVFLNTFSLLVRAVGPALKRSFPEVFDLRDDKEIGLFLTENSRKFQEFLDNYDFEAGLSSSQSGDDLFRFGTEVCSPWIRMFYISGGFVPSSTTWFESRRYVTFCEEHAVRTEDSGGWTFVDSLKPRYFNIQSEAGPIAVCSRIRQITNTLKYRNDPEFTEKIIPLVNRMVRLTPEIQTTLDRYHIPAGLPAWLGGIDHPEGILSSFEIPAEYKRVLTYLNEAELDILLEEFLVGALDEPAETRNGPTLLLTSCFLSLTEINDVSAIDCSTYINRSSIEVPARETGEKYRNYVERINRFYRSMGLTTIKDILDSVVSMLAIREAFEVDEYSPPKISVKSRLRTRRKHLLSLVPNDFLHVGEDEPSCWKVQKRINGILEERLIHKEYFMEHVGLIMMPSFQVMGIHRFCNGPRS
jgi:hypothetical protein